MGSGKMMVEFFSAEIEFRVWRNVDLDFVFKKIFPI
jgi:hypothetical protein